MREAEERLASRAGDPASWRAFLDETRRREFLQALPDDAHRARWAEAAFGAIRACDYTLEELFSSRVAAHPERTLFQAGPGREAERWSYARVARRISAIAAALLELGPRPRVALFVENGVEGACVDLACLVHDLFVAPLAPQLGADPLAAVVAAAGITVAVTDSEERLARLERVRERSGRPLTILLTDDAAACARDGSDTVALGALCARVDPARGEAAIAARPRFGLDDPATALFTSGSTGEEKGVVFTPFNLLTKRFARAAALPFVGEGEVLLCYLPLHHTFGRFLEMLGTVFWGGTYVFTGNPSLESLAAGLREVRPTGLVGIPARWRQLHDRCLALVPEGGDAHAEEAAMRAVTGGRLAWGLSAAGRLEPGVFRFFQRHGVALCSGFGMTEATGGITMTPPGTYEDESVGVPLPGIRVRFGPGDELQIAGPYVARYLDEPPAGPGAERWLGTGDVFRERAGGHLEIVDRVKDIYKNSRGRTVAPRRVEQKFEGTPGIRRTFLAGDGRDHNVLLVVPDADDPVFGGGDPEGPAGQEYLRRLVAAANADLAPWERVVQVAVLPRDFDKERELTPKGSYRRKAIEGAFRDVIDGLYRGTAVTLAGGGLEIRIPRWLYRDLGILEGDIALLSDGLFDRRRGVGLSLRRLPSRGEAGRVRVGDLEYEMRGPTVDLGLFAHQPLLWAGNPALAAFCPVKEGWDAPLGAVSPAVSLPPPDEARPVKPVAGPASPLAEVHRLAARALHARGDESLGAVRALDERLAFADARTAELIRRRLAALARHPDLRTRCAAYAALLVDEGAAPAHDLFAGFLHSGLPFLDRESIEAIAGADVDREHLLALRRRLQGYRTGLAWPATETMREQLAFVLELLAQFARNHRDYAGTVRAELAAWALHREDPPLARRAGALLDEVAAHVRGTLGRVPLPPRLWRERLSFHEGLAEAEVERLEALVCGTPFLEESVFFAWGEALDVRAVPPGGIWVTPVLASGGHRLFRVGIDADAGRHFDLLLVLRDDLDAEAVGATNLWMLAVGGHPGGVAPVPAFGTAREELGAFSVAWVDGLTMAERVRDLPATSGGEAASLLRTLAIRAVGALFSAWNASGRRIVPVASPANVVVPAVDYREGACVVSLAGFRPYGGPLSLAAPILRNVFLELRALYPRIRGALPTTWLLDGCVEGLGLGEARSYLAALERELADAAQEALVPGLAREVRAFLARLETGFHPPLALDLAVERYRTWRRETPEATPGEREDHVRQLWRLYRLDRQPDAVRYHLYRRTYFAESGGRALRCLDALLAAMHARPLERPARMVELSEVQGALESDDERLVFSRLVFPAASPGRPYRVGRSDEGRQVVVTSTIRDRSGASWDVRDAWEPTEVGQLYRLFVRSGIPHAFAERRRHLVVVDGAGRVVAGASYLLSDGETARLDGLVVSVPLRGRGLSSAILDDLCVRLSGLGVKLVTTHIGFSETPPGAGFRLDRRWGGLVRTIGDAVPA